MSLISNISLAVLILLAYSSSPLVIITRFDSTARQPQSLSVTTAFAHHFRFLLFLLQLPSPSSPLPPLSYLSPPGSLNRNDPARSPRFHVFQSFHVTR